MKLEMRKKIESHSARQFQVKVGLPTRLTSPVITTSFSPSSSASLDYLKLKNELVNYR